MKFLKLKNVPLSIFSKIKGRYGNTIPDSGPIPWIAMGFNVMIIQSKIVQYHEEDGDDMTYLPIYKEDKVEAYLDKIIEDMEPMIVTFPEKEFTAEIVEDDHATWKAKSEEVKAATKAKHEAQAQAQA